MSRQEKTDNKNHIAKAYAWEIGKKLMEFTQEQQEKLGAFTEGRECAQNFSCYDLESEIVFRKRTVGLDEYLECIGCTGDDPGKCPFSLIIFGNIYLCTCPVRDFIVKNIEN